MVWRPLSSGRRKLLGSAVGGSILTEDKVLVIKRYLASGHRGVDIAGDYGVHKGTIYAIASGKTWRHVNCGEMAESG